MQRRTDNRWPQQGTASAMCLSGHQFGQIHELELLDLSRAGVGACISEPIEPGTRVTLGFSLSHQPARQGTVVACAPLDEKFRLAVRFEHEQMLAA